MTAMIAAVFLIISNVFMTYAWYYHLSKPGLRSAPLAMVVLLSWGIAFFEYCFQVPGNRLGARDGLSTAQLKIMQEAITLGVFCLFLKFQMGESLKWNYYVGFALVLAGVFFVFHFNDSALLKKADVAHAPAAAKEIHS